MEYDSYDKYCFECCSKYCSSKYKIIMGSELCCCDCDTYCEDDPEYLIEDELEEEDEYL